MECPDCGNKDIKNDKGYETIFRCNNTNCRKVGLKHEFGG